MKHIIVFLWLYCTLSGGSAIPSQAFRELQNRVSFSQPQQQTNYSDIMPLNRTLKEFLNFYENPSVYQDFFSVPKNYFRRNQIHNEDLIYNAYYNLSRYEKDKLVNKKPAPTLVFKTYGRGKAQVTRQGEAVVIPNELARKNAYRRKETIKATVKEENESKKDGYRGRCKECPKNQTVVASRGNDFVILPEPCPFNPRMWNLHSGPRPGTKIKEGVHIIRGTLGPKKKFCEYKYQVLVRRCESLKAPEKDTIIKCSANDIWGSHCTISCGYEKEPLGPTILECQENLTWSHSFPTCKHKMDCSTPKVKSNSRIWCQTANMTHVDGNFIPNGSNCRFNKNGKDITISCKDGAWRISRRSKESILKKNKATSKSLLEKYDNACYPNFCQNGGTCLKPDLQKGSPICICRPQTLGVHCELRECDYNICLNDGLCFLQNGQRICYCLPEYSGEQCQHHTDY